MYTLSYDKKRDIPFKLDVKAYLSRFNNWHGLLILIRITRF